MAGNTFAFSLNQQPKRLMLRDSTCRGSRFSDFPDFQIVVGMLPLGRRPVWENLTNSSREVNTGNLHCNLGARLPNYARDTQGLHSFCP